MPQQIEQLTEGEEIEVLFGYWDEMDLLRAEGVAGSVNISPDDLVKWSAEPAGSLGSPLSDSVPF